MDDFDSEHEENRRRTETFRRIHQLKKRGFQPDWSITDVEDAIWFKHPGGYPDLIIYPDGMLVASLGKAVLNPGDKDDNDRIYNLDLRDVELFGHWLGTAAQPTWWQAGAATRERYLLTRLIFLFILGVSYLLARFAERTLRSLCHVVVG